MTVATDACDTFQTYVAPTLSGAALRGWRVQGGARQGDGNGAVTELSAP